MAKRTIVATSATGAYRPVTGQPAVTTDKLRNGDVATKHPDYILVEPDYIEMRDCALGSSMIKLKGETYLPRPDGFNAQKDGGQRMYDAYKMRAQFPELFANTIQGMIGIAHDREAKIDGLEEGSRLEYLWEQATPDGLTLEHLHRAITQEILTTGRVAILADVPAEGGDPYLAIYKCESLINWSDARDFFVLEEESRIRTGYSWDVRRKWRVLELADYETGTGDGPRTYHVRVITEGDTQVPTAAGLQDTTRLDEQKREAAAEMLASGDEIVVQVMGEGRKPLDVIPLVVAGSRDLNIEPDEIPLAGVARGSLAIYRLDADYRHQLYMSGQDTLVYIGLAKEDVPEYIGAGVAIALPADATAQYVGTGGRGLEAHKAAIENERDAAAAAGSRIFDASKRGAESGEALRIRSRAASASLVSVALCSAAALEQALRYCAKFLGLDEESIVVTPNLDFVDPKMTPQEAQQLLEVWTAGAISYQTLYDNLQKGGIASAERTAEEEQELAAEEQAATADEFGAAGGMAGAPAPAPENDNQELTDEQIDSGEGVTDEELGTMFSPELLGKAGVESREI